MKLSSILLLFLFSIPFNLFGQTPISRVNATYQNVTGPQVSYTAGGNTYTFAVDVNGTNNLNVIDFEAVIGGVTETYEILRYGDRVNIVRVDNGAVSGDKQLVFFEEASSFTSARDLRPSYLNTMEEVLLSEGINRGTDNVFANAGGTNENNIERIDIIFSDGVVVPQDPVNEGFVILERGGNDDFTIAAITGLDSNGNPSSFSDIVDVDRTTDWGFSQLAQIATRVLASNSPGDDLIQTARTTNQNIDGVLITYGQLGLSSGDSFFGYSIAGGDVPGATGVPGTSADWLDPAANFPTTTSTSSDGAGGLDLIAGGSVSSSNLVESSYTLTGGECWRMLSSPVPTTYANLLRGLWTQGTSGADYNGGPPNVLIWPTNQTGTDPNNWVTPNSLTDPLPAGAGVLVSVYADDNFDGTVDASEQFDKVISISGTGYEGNISPALNTNSDGWTLVGNPYNFPIDFGSPSLTKTNINNVAYVYDRNLTTPSPPAGEDVNGNTGGWRTTDGSYGDLTDGVIFPFQGFFIQNNGSSPVFTFSESAEDVSGTGSFYGKKKESPANAVRFEMIGEGLFNSAWITVSGDGSLERKSTDALELLPFSEDYLLFGSNKEGEFFDIGHFPLMENGEIVLEAETTKSGHYTITATDFNVNPDLELLFVDTEHNIEIPVDENFTYSFEIVSQMREAQKSAGNTLTCGNIEQVREQFIPTAAKVNKENSGRFILKVSGEESVTPPETPDSYRLNQNYPNPFNPTTQITYELPQQTNVLLEVFDMNGRQVATLVNESMSAGSHTVNFDASSLSSGVYIYKLQAGAVVLSRKLTLIK